MTHDPVNNPSHYAEGRKYEPINVIEDWELNYRLGNALKYISRAGRKNNAIEDLSKAVWYLQREIDSLEGSLECPYAVTYQDVLEYAANEASNGSVPLYEYSINVPQADVDEDPLPFWDADEDYMWDPSLGPVDLSDDEIHSILARKDLNQFGEDEIVSTFDRRGLIIGVKKDGSTCILNDQGKCQ